jgi:predicted nucleic acid-binding protein
VRVLFDTNVVLDVLLMRAPHAAVAGRLLDLVDKRRMEGLLCATTVTTVYYLAVKEVGARRATDQVRDLLEMFEVAPVDGAILAEALKRGHVDYEDAVLLEAARASGAEAIVTRNPKHFGRADIRVFDPREMLSLLRAGER